MTFVTSDLHLLDFKVALHLAQPPSVSSLDDHPFHNTTTDGYILAAALTHDVVVKFANEAGIDEKALLQKVTHEVPALMKKNGLSTLEAKDLIAAYMIASRFLKTKRSMSMKAFIDAVMNRIAKEEFDRIFASIIAAIKTVAGGEAKA